MTKDLEELGRSISLGDKIPLLGNGYIQLVDAWGSDRAIIEAARQSTDKGFQGWGETCAECGWAKGDDHEVGCSRPERYKPGDEKLLKFLWTHKHSTPFEFGGLSIEVQAPIMTFREWHRHRVPFGYSELSARYSPMPDLNYVPTLERLMGAAAKAGRNKQAGTAAGAKELTETRARIWLQELEHFYKVAEEHYQNGLKWGVPKELARIVVPVGRFSRMRATGNLRGWLGFCSLRCAPDAQEEIRVFAEQVLGFIGQRFPRTAEVVNSPT